MDVSRAENKIEGQVFVSAITGVEERMTIGEGAILTGETRQSCAEKKDIVWNLGDLGDTDAILTGDVLFSPSVGTLKLTVTVEGGAKGVEDYTQKFYITVGSHPGYSLRPFWNGRGRRRLRILYIMP